MSKRKPTFISINEQYLGIPLYMYTYINIFTGYTL